MQYNYLENQTELLINKIFKIKKVYTKLTIPVQKIKIKQNTEETILFKDSASPVLTYKGNNKETEFILSSPQHGIYHRIDCKSQETESSLMGRVIHEIVQSDKYYENKFCLILDKALLTPAFYKEVSEFIIKTNREDKVWAGSITDYEKYLNKIITTKVQKH